jgi:hypothetical protein
LVAIEKELGEAKMNNATLARYINAKRKKEDRRKEEACNKVEEGQSSKGLFPPASWL